MHRGGDHPNEHFNMSLKLDMNNRMIWAHSHRNMQISRIEAFETVIWSNDLSTWT